MGEKMNWSEAEAVVRAYRAEQGAPSDIDVATLARALGTDAGEVRRLAGRKPRFVDRSGVLSAGIALGVVVLGGLGYASHLLRSSRISQPTSFASAPLESYGDLQFRVDGEDYQIQAPETNGGFYDNASGVGELVPPRFDINL